MPKNAPKKPLSYPLKAKIWLRERTDGHEPEWVLELSGTINGQSFICRHPQPGSLAPEDVPGLPLLHHAEDVTGPWTRALCETILAQLRDAKGSADPLVIKAQQLLLTMPSHNLDNERRAFAESVTKRFDLSDNDVLNVVEFQGPAWKAWQDSAARWAKLDVPKLSPSGWLCVTDTTSGDMPHIVHFTDNPEHMQKLKAQGWLTIRVFTDLNDDGKAG
ncbi:hypothetical protein ACYPKM_02110 [Pseudomonas aeruginosa]